MELGELAGNRFRITVRDIEGAERIAESGDSLGGRFPNYFGAQRFGSRSNNHEVGADILRGDFKGAVMRFLTDAANETNREAIEARTRLREEQDFRAALGYFPHYLKYERSILDYLSKFENNYANAIRKLPRTVSLMFVHSVEDMIFNNELEQMIREGHTLPRTGDMVCNSDPARFYDLSKISVCNSGAPESQEQFLVANILGYETTAPTEFEREQMDKIGLTPESFKAKGLQELNCKGSKRVLFAPYREFRCETRETTANISFSLPAGSYATVFMEELMETRTPSGTSMASDDNGRNQNQ
jgi:tRNA pseudouridine13 synthase